MSENIMIKSAEISDWQDYKRIRLESLKNNPEAFGESHENASLKSEEEWKGHLEAPERFVMLLSEGLKTCGIGGAKNKGNNTWMVIAVYVSPEFRGRGYSKKLLNEILKELKNRNAEKAILMVNIDQISAIKLYESIGFKITDTVKQQIMGDGLPHDEYVMEKILAEPKPGQSFGKNVDKYAAARRGLPAEALDYIKEKATGVKQVLDLGCGTGIVTRQLEEMGFSVIGTDIDAQMIEQAIKDSKDFPIDYLVSPANDIPFDDEVFDMVTAFSAFHWFYDEVSINEIKRVLKPGGSFLILNGEDKGPLKKIMREVTKPFVPEGVSRGKENYEPKEFLTQQHFINVEEKVIPFVHRYSIEEAVLFVQSTSNWAFVPEDKNDEVIEKLRKLIEGVSVAGVLERSMEIKIVTGRKS